MSRKRAETTWKGTARIRCVIIDILPHVKITYLNRDANSAKSAYSGTLRFTVTQQEAEEKWLERI